MCYGYEDYGWEETEESVTKKWSIVVMGMETYDVIADSVEEAFQKALDCFADDDLYYGSELAERATINDCEVAFVEEIA